MTTANSDQHAAWNGESGRRWVASADHRDTVLEPVADLLLDAAAITAGERVLDIGCGATTLAAVGDALRPHHDPDHGVMLEAAVLLTTARTTP